MSFDYFYGQQSDLFTFYRVPKVLFTNERFWNISADAKMLYGILLDRMSLSAKNGWIDKNGRVYIIFTIDEAKMALNCAEQKATPDEGILHHPEGVDLVPSNIELSGMEVALVNAMSRETILRQYLDTVKQNYDYILLDCMPSLGMLAVNALAAADNVLIPVQAAYLPAKGLEQLLGTINKVKRQINPKLRIEGILLTMVDSRTNYSKDISNLIRESYGGKLKVYKTDIPRSVRAEEISAEGTSIFKHDPKGKVAEAYKILTKEVLNNAEKRRKHQLEGVR